MDTAYNIVISIRTLQGMLEIGNFFPGTDTAFAHSVFDQLKGDLTSEDDAFIRIDLEKKQEHTLPERLKSISCTLNQYTENCRIITRELFRFFALEK